MTPPDISAQLGNLETKLNSEVTNVSTLESKVINTEITNNNLLKNLEDRITTLEDTLYKLESIFKDYYNAKKEMLKDETISY